MSMITPLMNRQDVEAVTGLSRATIYREIAKGRFPKQVRIAPGRVAWRRTDIEEWLQCLATV